MNKNERFVTFEKQQPINTGGDYKNIFISDVLLIKTPDTHDVVTGVLFISYEEGIELAVGCWSGESFRYSGKDIIEKQIEWAAIKIQSKEENEQG